MRARCGLLICVLFVLDYTCFYESQRYEGDMYKKVHNITSAKECQLVCQNTTLCDVWTYLKSDYPFIDFRDTCILKDKTHGPLHPFKNVISGPKDCSLGESIRQTRYL